MYSVVIFFTIATAVVASDSASPASTVDEHQLTQSHTLDADLTQPQPQPRTVLFRRHRRHRRERGSCFGVMCAVYRLILMTVRLFVATIAGVHTAVTGTNTSSSAGDGGGEGAPAVSTDLFSDGDDMLAPTQSSESSVILSGVPSQSNRSDWSPTTRVSPGPVDTQADGAGAQPPYPLILTPPSLGSQPPDLERPTQPEDDGL